MNKEALTEYLKNKILDLNQDLNQQDPADEKYLYVLAQIEGYMHILAAVNEKDVTK